MTLRLTDEQDALLTRLAKSEGVSKNEAALRAILDRARRHEREDQIRQATRDAIAEYGPLLDRLAQ